MFDDGPGRPRVERKSRAPGAGCFFRLAHAWRFTIVLTTHAKRCGFTGKRFVVSRDGDSPAIALQRARRHVRELVQREELPRASNGLMCGIKAPLTSEVFTTRKTDHSSRAPKPSPDPAHPQPERIGCARSAQSAIDSQRVADRVADSSKPKLRKPLSAKRLEHKRVADRVVDFALTRRQVCPWE